MLAIRQLRTCLLFLAFALLAPPGILAQNGTMEFGEITSPALEGNLLGDPATKPFFIYLPPSYQTSERRYPVIYVMHGYGDKAKDMATWAGASQIDPLIQTGQSEEMIVVFADGSNRFNGSMYLSSKVIGDYETYITRDLVGYIDSHYRTLAHRYTRGITGHSMGGYGAMHLALKYPEVFGAVVAQSGFYDHDLDYWKEGIQKAAAVNPRDWEEFKRMDYQAQFAFMATAAPNPDKPPFFMDLAFEWVDGQLQVVPAVWARLLAADIVHGHLDRYLGQPLRLSGIKFTHGSGDLVVPVIQAHALDQAMDERGIDHVYVEYRGGHDFLWREALPFLSDLLRPELVPLREHLLSSRIRLDPAVVGRPTPVEARVVLDAPLESIGAYQQLYLDLSALGSAAEIPLQDEGNGRYTLSHTLTPLRSGKYFTLPVVVETSQGAQYKLIIPAAFPVFPAEDLPVLNEGLSAGWQVERGSGVERIDPAEAGVVYEGNLAGSFQVEAGSTWTVDFRPAAPVPSFGYTSLQFAFRTGDVTLTPKTRLTVALRADRKIPLFDSKNKLVDLEKKEWQLVQIPPESFAVLDTIGSIQFSGNFGGTFYLDDLRLVATPPPPAPTAVLEDYAASRPQRFTLDQNFPNPFNSSTVIRFELPQRGEVELVVYNLAGQRVATLLAGEHEAGRYTVNWDGRDQGGKTLASGVYLYRLQAGAQVETRKLLLLR